MKVSWENAHAMRVHAFCFLHANVTANVLHVHPSILVPTKVPACTCPKQEDVHMRRKDALPVASPVCLPLQKMNWQPAVHPPRPCPRNAKEMEAERKVVQRKEVECFKKAAVGGAWPGRLE